MALVGHGLHPDEVNPLHGVALLVVELDGADSDETAALAAVTRHLPCVVVGIRRTVTGSGDGADAGRAATGVGFDVLLSSDGGAPRPWVGCADLTGAVDGLAEAVTASPLASLSLVQLLRATEGLALGDAIVAESWVYSMLQSGERFAEWLRRSRRSRLSAPPSTGEPPVLVSRRGSRLEIELNRPEVRNALDTSMRDHLIDALRIAVADRSIELVRITGRGPAFSSGGDLDEFGDAPDPVTAHVVRVARSVGAWLSRCADRVEVDVHGACIGAGIEIPAFARDVRATKETVFSLPEVAMGLIPGAGGTASISRRVGRHRTAYAALSGTPVPASTALAWGLVDAIVDG